MFLTFSDAAKYADLARNIVLGRGYQTSFSFFFKPFFTGMWVPPFTPYSIALFFKIFGINDFAVIAASFFYFLLTLVFVFLLARKAFKSSFVGILSILAVGFSPSLINYASTGASESPFIFEIVAATYFVTLKKKWATVISFILLVLCYFTRPQAFIYMAGIILYYLLLNFKTKKALIYFGLVAVVGFLVDRFILTPLAGKYFIYSILGRGSNVLSQVGIGQSASDQLRSGALTYNFSILESIKKVLYNLYNFYKLLPQIINPYLFLLFVIGLFQKKNAEFKIVSLFMVVATLLVVAASIPFFRYIHPVIPFIYILAVGTLYQIIDYQLPITNEFSIFNFKISKYNLLIVISLFIILFFTAGQTFGILILDSRFEKQTHNVDKPPVYVVLSEKLKENTSLNQVVITNLDTWGSWYGERKTIWFPLSPKQLVDSSGKIPFDAIYLTDYLIDDQNYYMNDDWRVILNNPNDSSKWVCDGCSEIKKEFTTKGLYFVSPYDDYERVSSRAVLLLKPINR